MLTSKLHRGSVQRLCHLLLATVFGLGLVLPPSAVVHATVNNKVGLVTDTGGVDDNSFNGMAYAGLLRAQTDFAIVPTLYESASSDEYGANLQKCADDGNALCFAVGFTMADAVAAAAAANPAVHFAVLDSSPSLPPSNLRGILFNEKQAGYLAGALAGKMTTSNAIGAVGGMEIPPVVGFLLGYRNGAQCANANVGVLLNYTGTFFDPSIGEAAATDMISHGADVIFGAAGPTGNGAILYSAQHGVWSIGVDSDQYTSVFDNGLVAGSNKLLTSAMKRLDNAVYNTISDELAGAFTSGTITYHLANDGVGLAPYHETDSNIPDATKTYVENVKAGILAGTIDINATCRARSHIGLVTDVSGMGSMGYNDMAHQGLLRAQTDLGITPLLYQTASDSEYYDKLAQCAGDGNDLCFAVGFTMADAVASAASDNPGTHFAILDSIPSSPPANLRGIDFNVKQGAYLAGALAGKMTVSNVLGAVGGMKIPVVVDFMEGYQNGAQCAKPAASILTNYTGTFADPGVGATAAADMISQGADVIFAPAGTTGEGAILYSAQHGVWSLGVDTDQYVTIFGSGTVSGSEKVLSSVVKRVDNAAYMTIADELAGSFSSGTVIYDLGDGGVDLASYHDADASISAAVKTYVTSVKNGIIAGTIDVNYSCRPRFHAEVVENDVIGYDWYPGWMVGMTIDNPATVQKPDVSKTAKVDSNGTVRFTDLAGLRLGPGMVVTLSHSSTTKRLTVSNLEVKKVDPAKDTVSGTGTVGAKLNVQYCTSGGCLWRRSVTVQADKTWLANFSIPGGSTPEEQKILNILPGMKGEALQSDADNDNTDHQWHAPDPVIAPHQSIGAQDGWILETGENTNVGGAADAASATFRLGDDASRRQYRAILSFATGALPDNAVITNAKLTLRKQSVYPSGDPFTIFQGLIIDARSGFFGSANALQSGDFQAPANKTGLGPFKPALSGTLYSITLPSTFYPSVNKLAAIGGGLTQLRLRFKLDDNNNTIANYISFYSGNSAARPTLTITYYVPQ